jgi:2-polyprenyl-3-methyl-5-hydroxy-6-metoxy-1,4-benzoquinol methylase
MITIPEIQNIILNTNPHSYYETYMKYENNYWNNIPQWIIDYSKNKKINNILDIGCGYGTLGLFTKLNTNANLYCIDFMQYASNDLIEKYNINYKLNNIETEEFPWDIKFEICNFTEIFEHLNCNCIKTLTKIKNLLTDDGVIFFSTPNASTWGKLNQYNSWKDIPEIVDILEDKHIYQYFESELFEIFKMVGLKIDKSKLSKSINGFDHFNIQLSKVK